MNGVDARQDFTLDARLAADTLTVTDLPLSRVLLMDDVRFPWLILVPRRVGACEINDLDTADQATLWRETSLVAAALGQVTPCDKINIGALGNIVRQLHVHVVARKQDDAAWPGPVWSHGQAEPYRSGLAEERCQRLRESMAHCRQA